MKSRLRFIHRDNLPDTFWLQTCYPVNRGRHYDPVAFVISYYVKYTTEDEGEET